MEKTRHITSGLDHTTAAFALAGLRERFPHSEVWSEVLIANHYLCTKDATNLDRMREYVRGLAFALANFAPPPSDDDDPVDHEDPESLLLAAQEHLDQAITYLQEYCDLAGDEYTRAYILDHLRIMAHADHGFLSRDPNLDDVLAGGDQEEDDDDD